MALVALHATQLLWMSCAITAMWMRAEWEFAEKLPHANLTNTIIKLELSIPRLREALLRCPPDVLMTTSRTDWPGGPELLAAVRESGIYEQLAEIPASSDRDYGSFGGLIFRSTKKSPCRLV
ncbi:hypothetical protein FACS1894158_12390 [Betaproteobacteria bacterium]|nr:hypothetical protein FACS1894158_12390 [Betaproteobacteria bacterium]